MDPERLLDGRDPTFAHAPPRTAGIRRQSVDVLEGQAGVFYRSGTGVDGERERVDHEATSEARTTDAAQDGAVFEAVVGEGSARSRPLRRWDPVDRIDRSGQFEQRDVDIVLMLEADAGLGAHRDIPGKERGGVGGEADRAVLPSAHG